MKKPTYEELEMKVANFESDGYVLSLLATIDEQDKIIADVKAIGLQATDPEKNKKAKAMAKTKGPWQLYTEGIIDGFEEMGIKVLKLLGEPVKENKHRRKANPFKRKDA